MTSHIGIEPIALESEAAFRSRALEVGIRYQPGTGNEDVPELGGGPLTPDLLFSRGALVQLDQLHAVLLILVYRPVNKLVTGLHGGTQHDSRELLLQSFQALDLFSQGKDLHGG